MLRKLLVLVIGTTAIRACSAEPKENSVNPDMARARIAFAKPQTVAAAISLFATVDIVPIELVTAYGNHQAGYRLIPGMSAEDAVLDMQKKHEAFLDEATSTIAEALSSGDELTLEDSQRLNILGSELADARRDLLDNGLSLTGLTISGVDSEKLNGLVDFSISPVPSRQNQDPAPDETLPVDNSRTAKMYSLYHETWAPYGGTSKVTQWMTFQTFYFNNVSAFGSTSTYEHETQVYNKNFADYANYWASNLPSAYYDTSFWDSIDNFTIGSAQASSIAANTQYYASVSLTPGSASTATVRIKGQIGHRDPSWCYSTWCIWPNLTTGSMAMFTAPMLGMSWQY